MLSMLLTVWKETYGNVLKFPSELIALFPSDKVPSAGSHQESKGQPDSIPSQALAQDIHLSSGHVIKNVPIYYELYTSIVKALQMVLHRKSTVLTLFERRLLVGWSASHPQVATTNQKQLLALGRYSLLLEIKAQCEGLKVASTSTYPG
jgi:hypothetical protein